MPSADDLVKLIGALQGFADKDPMLCFWALTMLGIPPILKYLRK